LVQVNTRGIASIAAKARRFFGGFWRRAVLDSDAEEEEEVFFRLEGRKLPPFLHSTLFSFSLHELELELELGLLQRVVQSAFSCTGGILVVACFKNCSISITALPLYRWMDAIVLSHFGRPMIC